MKKVVVVAYAFPPVGGAGVQRPIKFVKYLREFGWEPMVMTVSNPSVPVLDYGLLSDLPSGVAVYRSPTLEPPYSMKMSARGNGAGMVSSIRRFIRKAVSALLLPDSQVLWWPGLITGLIKVVLKEKPACIFVTAPPFSSLIPVVAIGLLTGTPVVVDFRDEWAFAREQAENAVRNPLARFLDFRLERFAVARCTAFTAANGSYIDAICSAHPMVKRENGHIITNGFDQDDFIGNKAAAVENESGDTLSIVYVGSVWKQSSLAPFTAALHGLPAGQSKLPAGIRVKVIGRIVEAESHYLNDEKLSEVMELCGYLEHTAAVSEMCRADVLLLTLSDLPGAERVIAGKTFEYMATGRHILAIVPEGETSRLLREGYDNMTIVHPGDSEGIKGALEWLQINMHAVRERQGCDVARFHRRNLTASLAEVFNGVNACQ